MEHKLYGRHDEDAPNQIRDRNGDVCLEMCKVCGKGESELDDEPECPGPRSRLGQAVIDARGGETPREMQSYA